MNSTGQRNTIYFKVERKGGVYGTNGTTRVICFSESGIVAEVEERAVIEAKLDARSASMQVQYTALYRGAAVVPPVVRRRSRLALTLAEREEISRGMATDTSLRQIAARIGRSPSTVSREIARHGDRSRYRASEADKEAWDQARRPKPCRLAVHGKLQRIVAKKLRLDWSPEQIAGWQKRAFPGEKSMRVSYETIYRSLFISQESRRIRMRVGWPR